MVSKRYFNAFLKVNSSDKWITFFFFSRLKQIQHMDSETIALNQAPGENLQIPMSWLGIVPLLNLKLIVGQCWFWWVVWIATFMSWCLVLTQNVQIVVREIICLMCSVWVQWRKNGLSSFSDILFSDNWESYEQELNLYRIRPNCFSFLFVRFK